MFKTPYTYQQCLSTYLIWIASCIDKEQKDYYQECTSFEIWYDRHRGNRIQIIFFKNHEDYFIYWNIQHLHGELTYTINSVEYIVIL